MCGLRCGCTGSATIDWTLRDLGFVVEHMSTFEYQTMLRNAPERVLSGDIHRVLVRRAQDAFGGLADVMADPRILCRVSALHFWGYYDSANIAAESEEWSRPYRNRDIVFGAKNFVSKEIEPGRACCHSVPTPCMWYARGLHTGWAFHHIADLAVSWLEDARPAVLSPQVG